MAALAAGDELHVAVALLKDTHGSIVSVHAAKGILNDGAALVTEHEELHAVLLEPVCQLGRAAAADFLRAGGGQVDVALGDVAAADHFLGCLEEGHQAALGIRSAAAPDLSVGNIAGEGLVLPRTGRLHHIHVAHEEDGLLGGFALPFQKQVAVDFDFLTGSKNLREQFPQQLVKAAELFHRRICTVGNGLRLHHAGELLGVFVNARCVAGGNVLGMLAGHCQGAEDRNQQSGRQGCQQGQNDVKHNHFTASFVSFLNA